MALQAVSGVIYPNTPGITFAFTSFLLDAAGEKLAFIFYAPKTGTLRSAGFRLGTVTTGQTLKASFQDVSLTNGDPDGTVDQFRTVTVADTDDNTWKQTGIISSDGTDGGTKRTVTQGDLLALVIEFDSTVGNLNISGATASSASDSPFLIGVYCDHFTAAWLKSSAALPLLALEYDDLSFPFLPGVWPISASATQVYGNGSTPDEAALRLQLFPAKVIGGWANCTIAGNADFVLYDASSNVLASGSLDSDVRLAANGQHICIFTSEATLAANTTYRLSLKPTTATSVTLRYFDVNAAAILGQVQGGQQMYYSTRTDAGAWTDTTTRRPMMGLLISALDDGAAAGGGLLTHPGMSGGARG